MSAIGLSVSVNQNTRELQPSSRKHEEASQNTLVHVSRIVFLPE